MTSRPRFLFPDRGCQCSLAEHAAVEFSAVPTKRHLMTQALQEERSGTANSSQILGKPLVPILRWAGGKRQIISRLREFCPEDILLRPYCEPFLGAASLYLRVRPAQALLADANTHLIEMYRYIRDEPAEVSKQLAELALKDSQEWYYRVREEYNNSPASAAQAARFIYLNRTCFNGIFRVNKQGKFNVPYGFRRTPYFPSPETLLELSEGLSYADLQAGSYLQTLKRAQPGAFVYLDPPYPPLSDTANFAHYTMDRFNKLDQQALAVAVRDIDRRGCLFMMSNADTDFIRDLYSGYHIESLSVNRWITCKSKKHAVSEVIITNYR